jgi:hypothetical protein
LPKHVILLRLSAWPINQPPSRGLLSGTRLKDQKFVKRKRFGGKRSGPARPRLARGRCRGRPSSPICLRASTKIRSGFSASMPPRGDHAMCRRTSPRNLRRRCDLRMIDVPASIVDFIERHEGHLYRQLTKRASCRQHVRSISEYRRRAFSRQSRLLNAGINVAVILPHCGGLFYSSATGASSSATGIPY